MDRGALNLAQLTLACALGLEAGFPISLAAGHPKLCEWFGHIAARPSLQRLRHPPHLTG